MDLITLKRKRGSVKSKLSAFIKFIEKLEGLDKLSEVNVKEIELKLNNFQELIHIFDEIQTNIEVLVESQDEEFESRENFEDSFYNILSRAKILYNNYTEIASGASAGSVNLKQESGSVVHSSGVSDVGSTASVNAVGFKNQIKFPDIPLPKFNGNFEDWLEYRDTFKALINDCEDITPIQKYHYLRASLVGAASEVIKSFSFCSENYFAAWDLLNSRYNNNRILISNHVNSLFKIEQVVKSSSKTLRNLVDSYSKQLRALEQLNQPTSAWDLLVIYIIVNKLDSYTRKGWEEHASLKETPTLDQLTKFLNDKANLFEALEQKDISKTNFKEKRKENYTSNFHANTSLHCPKCKGGHTLNRCPDFLKLGNLEKLNLAKELRVCLNCLRCGHFVKECTSYGCKKCHKKHNTELHMDNIKSEVKSADGSQKGEIKPTVTMSCFDGRMVLLATIMVNVIDINGKTHSVKGILDSGSMSNFMSYELCKKLGLSVQDIDQAVSGIGQQICHLKHKCKVTVKSRVNDFSVDLDCLVIPKISNELPSYVVKGCDLNIPKNVQLANPEFKVPSKIDLLIGSGLFYNLITGRQIKFGDQGPILQETYFGWVVAGPISANRSKVLVCNFSKNMADIEIRENLEKFWAVEECGSKKPHSAEEKAFIKHFSENTSRLKDGRFEVALPFKQNPGLLGDSYAHARQRFYSLERKLIKDNILKDRYVQFLEEYEIMGHMEKISSNLQDGYFLPHHGVIKEESTSTKCRVVFDASAVTSSGYSLNDLQMMGPTIQEDLISILLRFRKHKIIISGDIVKMYRMINVKPEHRKYQRILFRKNPSDKLETYQLSTVTYGERSASFLAVHCLFELARDCESKLPNIAKIIREDFYMDDLLSGCDDVNKACLIAKQIRDTLEGGCFNLSKWKSNSPEVIKALTSEESLKEMKFDENYASKTLGLIWEVESDKLTFRIGNYVHNKVTKRIVLSTIAQIFDPIGLLSPCTILAKIMLQNLWKEKLDWDDQVSVNLRNEWDKFIRELQNLNSLKIDRHIVCENPVNIQLHGYSDASEGAYGACIYLRSIDPNGKVHTRLLSGKSKVAPLKTLTIPRLELCGALLLARLVEKAVTSLQIHFDKIIYWTDSMIVLGWINTSPNLLKTFVNNRIAEIQELTKNGAWRHVSSKNNPADLISRGLYPGEISSSDLWWLGSSWLRCSESEWDGQNIDNSIDLPELKGVEKVILKSTLDELGDFNMFDRFSKYGKMLRTTAYVLKFIRHCNPRNKIRDCDLQLTVVELGKARDLLIRLSQRECFSQEISLLKGKRPVRPDSKLSSLNPFLDENDIIRVGGRLNNSNLEFERKHPIVLSSGHRFTQLLVLNEHLRLMHAGPQLILSSIRESFWLISGRNLVRKVYRSCIKCFRYNSREPKPIMADLPKSRVTPSAAFTNTGLDYGGPFLVADRKGRGRKLTKCWICLFVCFSTKAVHIELVSSLTVESFILALRRFVARRSIPSNIYSDNAKTFVGAKGEIFELSKLVFNNKNTLKEQFSGQGITWHFIPPYSPHFGGLWEAGIRSVKAHLKRVIGETNLTFEEFSTLLAQVEAILNSRPLFPLSSDPADLNPVTPAHFLVGKSLVAVPEENVQEEKISRITRFQLIQRFNQAIWERWNKEYISELQQRFKWKSNYSQLKLDSLVLIKDPGQPPLKWLLGRVVEIHKGKDGVARVAILKTANGLTTRSFARICPLPLD